MKVYKIPFDIKHEEKIFGGYLSLRQVLYLLLIILTAGVFFINIQMWIKLTIFCSFALVFLSFAFIDGLVASKVIEDDSISKMFYCVKGYYDKKPHTEVTIFEAKKFMKWIRKQLGK